ncbi:hypothetical protein [Cognatishimia sp. MH4019]|uniref:hypothetical protein n=1 Tax=Cognatishimia sp. MH4019 TaxID=2854030 RepID=UPI001CD66EF6|nr:hypothetical protein [Cognatishimia sp. MH4019]
MKYIASTSAALLLSTSLASAAGLDRSGQSVAAIFADDSTVSLSFGVVEPNVVGKDDAGNSYNVGESYTQLGFSYTQVLSEQASVSLIFDQPYGANVNYEVDPSTSALGGTRADLSSESLGIVGKFQFNERFSVFGGVKAERVRAEVDLNGTAYADSFITANRVAPTAASNFNGRLGGTGLPNLSTADAEAIIEGDDDAISNFISTYGAALGIQGAGITPATFAALPAAQQQAIIQQGGQGGVDALQGAIGTGKNNFFNASGYQFEMEDSTKPVFLIGAAYEIPDIALRVALTYHFETEHTADTKEQVLGQTIKGEVDYVTPQSVNLDFQTGIAEDTLLTASYRWTEFSAVDVVPDFLQADLVNLEDGERYTIGIARRFSDSFAGSATFLYEPEGDDLVSPLGPTNGLMGLTLGGRYTKDNVTLSGGINYSVLGDASANVGGDGVADFEGSTSYGFGFNAAFTF